MPHRVAVLALDGVKPFDLGIPAQVFEQAVDLTGEPLYEVVTCAVGGAPVRTSHDFQVVVEHDEDALRHADTVIVATQDHRGPLPEGPGALSAPVRAALAAIPPATRIVSFCTSAFVLAAAGLLDRQSATTHWGISEEFARRFPTVDVDPNVLFVDNGRILTGAGAAAGIDLCLHLIRCDFGAEIANAVARSCVVAPWREGGQTQFIERPVPAASRSTSATRHWALLRLDEPMTVDDLARHARMSERTFARCFRAEVGQSPHRWLVQQRVDLARRLLETTDLTVDQVARRCGFPDAAGLRKHVQRRTGLTPTAYRSAHSTMSTRAVAGHA